MTEPRPRCPVCAGQRTAVTQAAPEDFEYGVRPAPPLQFFGCAACGSEFLSPRPTADLLPSFYPADYHAYHEDHGAVAGVLVRLRARGRGRRYRALLGGRTAGRLFDVGTGDCRHFEDLRRYCDLECAGVEINPEIAARARQLGYQVATGTLEAFDTAPVAGTFDVVSMYHVIEHVVDPALVLRKCGELLRPGGYLLGQTPRVDAWERRLAGRRWGGYHYPRHLQIFSRRALADSLRRAGFDEVRVTPAPHLQSALSVQNSLASLGLRMRMTYGKCRFYSGLLLGVAPFELLAFAAGRPGIMNFAARKPPATPSAPAPTPAPAGAE